MAVIRRRPLLRQAPPAALGFTTPELPSIDMADWKTWALIALAGIVLYQLFFSKSVRDRRDALRQARARYKAQVAKIREAY